MVKLFGFRITPFFFFILGLECLTLLFSIYLGILLYKGSFNPVSLESIDFSFHTGVLLIALISILTPGFFSQIRVLTHIKKSVYEKIIGMLAAVAVMSLYVFSSNTSLDSKTLFIAAVLSACFGLSVTKFGMLSRYWRFLVRADVN